MLLIVIAGLKFLTAVFSAPFAYWHSPEKPNFELTVLNQKINSLGSFAYNKNVNQVSPIGVDQVFKTAKGGIIFLKTQMTTPQQYQEKLIDHPKGLIFNSKFQSGKPFSLFFYNFKKAEALKWVSQIKNPKKISLLNYFVPQAHANGVCAVGNNSLSELIKIREGINKNVQSDILMSCALSATYGQLENVKNLVTGSLQAVQTLFTDPAKLWNKVVDQFESVKQFVMHFQSHMQELMTAIAGLDPKMIAQRLCSLTAESVIQFLVGGGIAGLTVFIAQKVQLLSRIKNTMSAISKGFAKAGWATGNVTQEALACYR
jgi:hypothetical protein